MMRSILLIHARRYPKMEPTDVVKLLYQSEFGGGHLISDENACLRRLEQEYAGMLPLPGSPLAEDIGGGMVRIHLAALGEYTLADLGRDFLRSAALQRGSMAGFRRKLALLTELTAAGQMPFSSEALAAYLTAYEAAGFPAVSHSPAYRRAYHPAYRVVRREVLPEWILKNCNKSRFPYTLL